jgi:hypothetical protein
MATATVIDERPILRIELLNFLKEIAGSDRYSAQMTAKARELLMSEMEKMESPGDKGPDYSGPVSEGYCEMDPQPFKCPDCGADCEIYSDIDKTGLQVRHIRHNT